MPKNTDNFLNQKDNLSPQKMFRNSAIPTTTSLCRIRGFTIDLLFLLSYGARRTPELAKASGKNRSYVNTYLNRMWIYGLVEKQRLFWKLTPLGLEIYDYFNNNTILTNKQTRTPSNNNTLLYKQHIDNRKITDRQQIDNTSRQKLPRQLSIDLWQRKSSLDDTEKEVVEVLIKHYNETGSKFILVKDQYEMAERLRKNPQDVMAALKTLREDNIVYLYRSTLDGIWKVGLKKDFVEKLKLASLQGDTPSPL